MEGRGWCLYHLNRYSEAIVVFNKLIEVSPEYVDAYQGRGQNQLKKGNHEQAIKDFDKAIGLNSEYPAAYEARGKCWYELGETEKAVKDLAQALVLDSQADSSLLRKILNQKEMDRIQQQKALVACSLS